MHDFTIMQIIGTKKVQKCAAVVELCEKRSKIKIWVIFGDRKQQPVVRSDAYGVPDCFYF